jgi:probable F420-dependent oxidoreductase
MDFIFQYPDFHGPDGDMLGAGSIGDIAQTLERSGWDGFALTEHPAPGAKWLASGGHQSLDPFVALAGAATVTKKIRLLTYLSVLPYRNPMLLAKAAATVDRLSNGRFVLGAGTGYLKGEFRAVGVDFEARNVIFDEALDVMPLHWSGKAFDYDGAHVSARQIQARPSPIQQPIPIWLGGNAKITRRRVAERCQGWMPLQGPEELFATTRTPSLGSTSEIAAKIEEIKNDAAKLGRKDKLEFVAPYEGLVDPRADIEMHRERFASLEADGFTSILIATSWAAAPKTEEFIAAFGETYLS